jgi:hypothetical protein
MPMYVCVGLVGSFAKRRAERNPVHLLAAANSIRLRVDLFGRSRKPVAVGVCTTVHPIANADPRTAAAEHHRHAHPS